LERIDCDKDVRTYPYADHCTAMFFASLGRVHN